MARFIQTVLIVLTLMSSAAALAAPAEEANAVVDQWSAAYTSNEPEAVTRKYWPDAILLGTVSPVISEGGRSNRKILFADKGYRQQERGPGTAYDRDR